MERDSGQCCVLETWDIVVSWEEPVETKQLSEIRMPANFSQLTRTQGTSRENPPWKNDVKKKVSHQSTKHSDTRNSESRFFFVLWLGGVCSWLSDLTIFGLLITAVTMSPQVLCAWIWDLFGLWTQPCQFIFHPFSNSMIHQIKLHE